LGLHQPTCENSAQEGNITISNGRTTRNHNKNERQDSEVAESRIKQQVIAKQTTTELDKPSRILRQSIEHDCKKP